MEAAVRHRSKVSLEVAACLNVTVCISSNGVQNNFVCPCIHGEVPKLTILWPNNSILSFIVIFDKMTIVSLAILTSWSGNDQ